MCVSPHRWDELATCTGSTCATRVCHRVDELEKTDINLESNVEQTRVVAVMNKSNVIKSIARFSDQHPSVVGAHAARPSMTCMFIFNNMFSSKGFSLYFVILSAGLSVPNIVHSSMAPDLTLVLCPQFSDIQMSYRA